VSVRSRSVGKVPDHHTGEREPRLLRALGQDVRRLGADIRREGLQRPVRRTFSDLKEFYLSAERKQRLAGMGRLKRTFFFSLWLLKGLFLKLTPVRRVLLVLALVFIFTTFDVGPEGSTLGINDVPFVGLALLLLVLMLELKDKLLARGELEAGRAVQEALTPNHAPQVAGWDVWLFTRSANDVGGDLVDYLRLQQDRTLVALGDVAGKGLSAALLMAKLQATIRALAPEFDSLAAVVEKVNHILYRDGLPNRFATLVLLDVCAGGRVRLVNAGHMPPLRIDDALEELPRGGIALGLRPTGGYTEQETMLARGDILVVYSDGVTEAMNGRLEFFGDDRLRAVLAGAAGSSAEQTGSALVAAVDAFVGDARPHDDLSLVVLRRTA
jgi:hypothetical protein